MRAETVLGAAIGIVIVASLVAAAAFPGALAEEEPVREGRVDVADVTIARGEVSGETATLTVTTHLAHRGGRSENLTVRVRAFDTDTGMLATTREVPIEPVVGDREVTVPVNVTLQRQGGYRVEVLVYKDDRRVETASRSVEGVGTLEPSYAESPVRFHRFDALPGSDALPAVQYSIASAEGDRVTLEVSAYLTNRGGEVGDLRVEFVLRQADSNIVAARASTSVGDIRPGRTAASSVSVTVPDGYNYYVDAILYKDGVIIDSARSAANLDPRRTISVNRTVEDVGLEVGDFEREPGEAGAPPRATGTPPAAQTPGLGIGAALAALGALAAALLARRHT